MPEERLTVAAAQWLPAVGEARDRGYAFFDWLSAVDETDRADEPGIEVVCHLIDPTPTPERDQRVLLMRTRVPVGEALASITGVFAGAAWHERETHEMFGIDFTGFTDASGRGMRPLLLPEGFEGTPLRKSFVLASRVSKPWPGAKEPGEGATAHAAKAGRAPRRKLQPPGVPDESWGPR